MLCIKEIEAKDTYQIRHQILRPNQSLEQSKYAEDDNELAFHLGGFFNQQLISIASFYQENHPAVEGKYQYRLRGMATLEEYRKMKAGSSLIKQAEQLLRKKNVDVLWCNARITVTAYYQKLGFQAIGDAFDINPIGLHYLMYKQITD